MIGRVGALRRPVALALAVVGMSVASGIAAAQAGVAPATPRPAFVNTTADHRHDRALAASLGIFQQATGIQAAVVLEQRLPAGRSLEAHAVDLFGRMGLGRATSGQAILLLWAQTEQQFKIEVSYNLEGVLPDLVCHQLEQAARSHLMAATPDARRDFITELLVTLRIHVLQWRASGLVPPAPVLALPRAQSLSSHLSGGAGVARRDYQQALERAAAVQAPPEALQATRFAAAASARETLQRYLASLEEGVGSPQLGLLTEGSRYARMERPRSAAHAQRVAAYYRKALPMRFWEQGDLAVAMFQPGHPVLPVLLQRDAQGLWQVNEARAEAQFQLAEQGGSAVAKFADFPHARAWRETAGVAPLQPLFASRALAPPPLASEPLAQRLAWLQQRARAADAKPADLLALAQALHFDLYWLQAAAPLYEAALAAQATRDDIRWTLVDVYANTSDVDAQERHLRALAASQPGDAFTAYYLRWVEQMYPK